MQIINPNDITAFIKDLSGDERTQALLQLALRKALPADPRNLQPVETLPEHAPRWLREKWPEGGPYYRFSPNTSEEAHATLRHIVDWISGAVQDKDRWLNVCDPQGRPHRLMQIKSLEQATSMADKEMRLKSERLRNKLQYIETDEEVIHRFENGYTIVRLRTPEDLDYESAHMGHCLGHGSYDAAVQSTDYEFFSLRDQFNKPHASMEIYVRDGSNILMQCKGAQNRPPITKYMPYVQQFIEQRQFEFKGEACDTGLICHEGKYYDVLNLPAGLDYPYGISYNYTIIRTVDGARQKIPTALPLTFLPDHLTLGGLNLAHTPLKTLPAHLTVWNLNLQHSQIEHLVDGLHVTGNCEAMSSKVCTIGKNVKVDGIANFDHSRLSEIPDGFSVGGNLTACNTPLTKIGKNVRIGRHALFCWSKLTEIGENLHVEGTLRLNGTPLKKLPEGLYVKGDLDLQDTAITEIPASARIEGTILWPKHVRPYQHIVEAGPQRRGAERGGI